MNKTLIASLLICLWMTACGQKGPLYLPPDETGQEQVDQSVEVSSIEGSAAGSAATSVDLS